MGELGKGWMKGASLLVLLHVVVFVVTVGVVTEMFLSEPSPSTHAPNPLVPLAAAVEAARLAGNSGPGYKGGPKVKLGHLRRPSVTASAAPHLPGHRPHTSHGKTHAGAGGTGADGEPVLVGPNGEPLVEDVFGICLEEALPSRVRGLWGAPEAKGGFCGEQLGLVAGLGECFVGPRCLARLWS